MVVVALVLLLFDIFMLFSMALGWVSHYIKWFGDEFLTYCVYTMMISLPVIWLSFLNEPYYVAVSNSKEIANDLAEALEKRSKKEGK